MNMNDYFLRAFGRESTINVTTQIEEELTEVFFKELATACAINMIASLISKCEFRTFIKGIPEKKGEYYLWNYEPNQNQNAGDFWQQFVTNLLYDNAALIVEVGGKLYVADSFTRTHYSFREDVFNNITIGDLTMQRSMLSHEVIYLELDNINARRRLEGSYTAYGQTVAKAIRSVLRAGAQKGILNIDAQTAAQPDFTAKLQTLITDRFKPFYDTDSAVLPLQTGYTYTDVTKQTTAPTPADLNERINYEFEMAGRAYKIPKALMLGDVSDVEKITKNFFDVRH